MSAPDEFLRALFALCQKHEVTLSGCGCCGSPFVEGAFAMTEVTIGDATVHHKDDAGKIRIEFHVNGATYRDDHGVEHVYRIRRFQLIGRGGADLGEFEADSLEAARDMMAIRHGYANYEEALALAGNESCEVVNAVEVAS